MCDAQFVVTASAWNDCITLLRCWRFWCGLPEAMVFAGRTLGPLSSAYDATVTPLLRIAADDPAQEARMDGASCKRNSRRATEERVSVIRLRRPRKSTLTRRGAPLSPPSDCPVLRATAKRVSGSLRSGRHSYA